MNKYTKPELTLREALAKENIGNNIVVDLSSLAEGYFGSEEGEQED